MSCAPRRMVLRVVSLFLLSASLAAAAPPGTIPLAHDLAAAPVANQAGSIEENTVNGWLELAGGRVTIGSKPVLGRP